MRGNLTDLKINVGRVNWYFVVQRKYFSSNVECGTFLPSTKFLLQLWTIQFEQMTHELIPCFSPNDSIARENYNQSETCYSRDNVRANHIIFNTFLEKPHELGHDFLRRQHTDLHRFFFLGKGGCDNQAMSQSRPQSPRIFVPKILLQNRSACTRSWIRPRGVFAIPDPRARAREKCNLCRWGTKLT